MIDDDPMIRQFVELVLHQAGYRVSSAATGAMGVEALQESRWDLILLDIELPDMTGLNVLGVIYGCPRSCKGLLSNDGTISGCSHLSGLLVASTLHRRP
ncbi:response regulator [Caulobacter sp.]|uniref:response regulator n=1 Tax=Caulobacter sp. TaxID=78 RepID=UPI001620495E